jgi:hypothetical protein
MRAFIRDIMHRWWESDLEGGTRQDLAVKHGVLIGHDVTEPCGEMCECADAGEWPLTCYRLAEEFKE